MATISLVQGGGRLSAKIPHKVLVDGCMVGIMQGGRVQLRLPSGSHRITVQSLLPWFSATQDVAVADARPLTLAFRSRDGWWDALFLVDLGWWVAKFFLHITPPWTWISELLSDGFFLLWLFYEWKIRKHYFRFSIT